MSAAWLRNGVVISHVVLTAVMVWWSIDLARSVDTFSTSISYHWFQITWPFSEDGWAIVFGTAAAIGMAGLYFENRWARLLCAVLLAWAHGQLAWATYWSNGASTGTGTYAILATFALWRIWAEGLL